MRTRIQVFRTPVGFLSVSFFLSIPGGFHPRTFIGFPVWLQTKSCTASPNSILPLNSGVPRSPLLMLFVVGNCRMLVSPTGLQPKALNFHWFLVNQATIANAVQDLPRWLSHFVSFGSFACVWWLFTKRTTHTTRKVVQLAYSREASVASSLNTASGRMKELGSVQFRVFSTLLSAYIAVGSRTKSHRLSQLHFALNSGAPRSPFPFSMLLAVTKGGARSRSAQHVCNQGT